MEDNETVIRRFIADWSSLDPDLLVAYFTEDGVYHNMPMKPVAGHAALRAFIAGFLRDWQKTDWEIVNLLSRGDLVMAERIDRTVAGGRPVELPCVAVFEMRDGRIAVWRDYFDMATYTRTVTG